ncbi:MAG: hypothetical protein ACP5XB_08175 [Isosphaeraceae bacterium]
MVGKAFVATALTFMAIVILVFILIGFSDNRLALQIVTDRVARVVSRRL